MNSYYNPKQINSTNLGNNTDCGNKADLNNRKEKEKYTNSFYDEHLNNKNLSNSESINNRINLNNSFELSNNQVIQKQKDGFNYLQFRKLLDLGINHAYTLKPHFFNTRPGLVSNATSAKSIKNYQDLCKALNLDFNKLVKPNQTHTNILQSVNELCGFASIEDKYIETDGLISNIKGSVLASVNADCILLLFYDPVKKVIANIHSGWKGTFNKIAENCINKMKADYGCNPLDIIVCICPSIRKCHFQVEKDVKLMCEKAFSYTNRLSDFIEYVGKNEEGVDKWVIDTVLITKIVLMDCGIVENNIFDCGICSVCNSGLINSRRADGEKFGLGTAVISL